MLQSKKLTTKISSQTEFTVSRRLAANNNYYKRRNENKETAEMKNDHKLHGQIQDVDLIAKELMMHKQCYLEYTRCLSSKTKDTAQEDIPETQGDFDKVKEFISDAILECNKAVSMTALHKLYGTDYSKENEKVYRNKFNPKQAGLFRI